MNIAIWGAGDIGKYVYRKITDNKNYSVKYFVDRNEMLWGTVTDGVKIISPKQLEKIFARELDFVLVAFFRGASIYQKLVDLHISKFGIVEDRVYFSQLDFESDLYLDRNIFWSGDLHKPLIRHLETNIVDSCNLNCKGCSHFSNLFESDDKVPFDVFCSDLQKIADHVEIYSFLLLGGEPLLEGRINDYIRAARKILPHSVIQLTTNGLLIPKQTKEFFECCEENDIEIIISAYKPTMLLMDKIVKILEDEKIRYKIRENREAFGKNIDLTGTADQNLALQQCREKECHFFRVGRIYKCPFEALANKFFEQYNLDVRFDGGFDIYDENLDWHMVVDTLVSKPVNACKYCGIEEKFEWCVSNTASLEDWVVKKN